MPIDPREWLQNSAPPSSDRVGEESVRSADEADAEVARIIAVRKLAARARTRYELDQALQAKNVPPSVKDAVLDRMQEVGLVDDASFAADWVASRQQRRHLSRRALRRELEAKGVERSDIDSALHDVDLDSELTAARELVERKQATMSGLARDVQYRRLAGILGRRGFDTAVTVQVLNELFGPVSGERHT